VGVTALRTRLAAWRRWAEPYARRVDDSIPGHWYSRVLELEIIDRAVAMAAKLFVAFFPFVLGVASLLPAAVRRAILASLVDRFGLSGEGLQVVQGAFATTGQTKAATGLLGGLLLFFYATSFTTALQRVFLRAWRRPTGGGGLRNQGRGLGWLGGILAFFAINGFIARVLTGGPGTALRLVVGLATSIGVWWWTAHTMLRAEVRWRPLLPGAVTTGVAMMAYVLASNYWMPQTVTSNSEQFGFFGVALSLVSWFVGVSFLIVAAAALCPVLVEGDGRIARWLKGPAGDPLVEGARPALPGPTRRLTLIDALGLDREPTS